MPAQSRALQHPARSLPRRSAAASAVGLVAVAVVLAGSAGAAADEVTDPDFELPFACGEYWSAETRAGHSPSIWSVDFNADDDLGHPVIASTSGVVTTATDQGDTSYGQYVVVDHGNEWTSLYAHLERMLVTPGQHVDQGEIIGLLGTSGGSTGPHLHFEERLDRAGQPAVFHDEALVYNSTVRSLNCPDVPLSGDWNGDRRADVATWRRSAKGGVFSLRGPDGTATKVAWGENIDTPVSGDWNGDGVTDVGVWQRLTSTFVLRTAAGAVRTVDFGTRRALPLTGDWDGNGRTDVGSFSPRRGVFKLLGRQETLTTFQFGSATMPVTGDWNGDGRTDVGVYDSATATWSLRADDGSASTMVHGAPGDLPVTGDWDGDGVTDVGTWSPSTATFWLGGAGSASLVWGHRRG